MSDAAHARVREQIERLRSLGNIAAEVAPDVARELDTELRANIARGVDPEGRPWQPTAAGEQPLRNAGRYLTVRAIGSVVIATLVGPVARHHRGTARGRVTRRILPTRKLTRPLVEAIKRVVLQRLHGGT